MTLSQLESNTDDASACAMNDALLIVLYHPASGSQLVCKAWLVRNALQEAAQLTKV